MACVRLFINTFTGNTLFTRNVYCDYVCVDIETTYIFSEFRLYQWLSLSDVPIYGPIKMYGFRLYIAGFTRT